MIRRPRLACEDYRLVLLSDSVPHLWVCGARSRDRHHWAAERFGKPGIPASAYLENVATRAVNRQGARRSQALANHWLPAAVGEKYPLLIRRFMQI